MAETTTTRLSGALAGPSHWFKYRKAAIIAAGVIIAIVGVAPLALTRDLTQSGYAGVFAASLASSATLFVPLPGMAAVMAASTVLEPWAVGLLAGVGGALGELTGYCAGCCSVRLTRRRFISRWLEGFTQGRMGGVILAVSIIPNPFVDGVGIIAGRMCYSVRRFLLYSAIGKVSKNILIAYATVWGFNFIV